MTRDNAIFTMEYYKLHFASNEEVVKAFDMAISALEREPSISGDGTLIVKVEDGSKVGRVFVSGDDHSGGLYYSDTLQPKMGQWLSCAEENGKPVKWVCSSCMDVKSITKNKTEFCPVCGARLGMTDKEIVDKLTELTTGAIDHLDLNDVIDLLCEIKRILSRRDRSE